MIKQTSAMIERVASYCERLAPWMLRVALAAVFSSAVADRFGLWGKAGEPGVAWGSFGEFTAYTALLNPYLPVAMVSFIAVLVTGLELLFAGLMLAGRCLRPAALGSTFLLGAFALAMTVTSGPKAPLDYGVYVAASAALALVRLTPSPVHDD